MEIRKINWKLVLCFLPRLLVWNDYIVSATIATLVVAAWAFFAATIRGMHFTSVIFQCAGALAFAITMASTCRQLGYACILHAIKSSLPPFPTVFSTSVIEQLQGQGMVAMAGNVATITQHKEPTTIAEVNERLRDIENQLQQEMGAMKADYTSKISDLDQRVSDGQAHHASEIEKTNHTVRSLAVGGFLYSFLGALWWILGALLGTIAEEIVCWRHVAAVYGHGAAILLHLA
jgi:hypothetical protein